MSSARAFLAMPLATSAAVWAVFEKSVGTNIFFIINGFAVF
jgi:hypothetical protein